jgi:hypothetical protein
MKTLLLLLLTASAAAAQTIPFSPDVFDKWVEMRVGDGKKPAIWYCYGEVYSYPDGKLMTRMEGIDQALMLRISRDSVVQMNRKIFVYTDPASGSVLSEMNGKPVSHIEYPYQKITYALRGEQLATYVEQGTAPRLTRMGPGFKTTARRLTANTYVFSSPVFLNFETPRGKYEAYENYDFFVDLSHKKTRDRYQLTWNRYGDLPPFAGSGKGVIQLVCYRVDTFDELPDTLKKHIREKAPLWQNPPQSLAEIAQLQAGK